MFEKFKSAPTAPATFDKIILEILIASEQPFSLYNEEARLFVESGLVSGHRMDGFSVGEDLEDEDIYKRRFSALVDLGGTTDNYDVITFPSSAKFWVLDIRKEHEYDPNRFYDNAWQSKEYADEQNKKMGF